MSHFCAYGLGFWKKDVHFDIFYIFLVDSVTINSCTYYHGLYSSLRKIYIFILFFWNFTNNGEGTMVIVLKSMTWICMSIIVTKHMTQIGSLENVTYCRKYYDTMPRLKLSNFDYCCEKLKRYDDFIMIYIHITDWNT